MINWYNDNNIEIWFDKDPSKIIEERHITPQMSKEEKRDISKLPIISTDNLTVHIIDKRHINIIEYNYTIPSNTKSDGATINRIFWTILGITPIDPRVIESAFIHDFSCLHHYIINNDRKLSSIVFERMLYIGGVDKFRRFIMYHLVDLYQMFLWKKS